MGKRQWEEYWLWEAERIFEDLQSRLRLAMAARDVGRGDLQTRIVSFVISVRLRTGSQRAEALK